MAEPKDPAQTRDTLSRRTFLKSAGGVAAGGMLAERLAAEPEATPLKATAGRTLAGDVERFRVEYPAIVRRWRGYLRAMKGDGLRVVLWGGGSKAVAFLTALGLGDEIACAVDINPRKAGTYLAGTGHQVVAPESLSAVAPDVVIVMNPVYTGEIRDELRRLGLSPRLVPLDPDTPGGLAPEHASP